MYSYIHSFIHCTVFQMVVKVSGIAMNDVPGEDAKVFLVPVL